VAKKKKKKAKFCPSRGKKKRTHIENVGKRKKEKKKGRKKPNWGNDRSVALPVYGSGFLQHKKEKPPPPGSKKRGGRGSQSVIGFREIDWLGLQGEEKKKTLLFPGRERKGRGEGKPEPEP